MERFFLENGDTVDKYENYIFKSEITPLQHEGLMAFDEDLYAQVKNIKFKQACNAFQPRLISDARKPRNSPITLIPVDKTTNLYEEHVNNYLKLLKNDITTPYQKADDLAQSKIMTEAQHIAHELKLNRRVESCFKRNAFITLKVLKRNVQNHPKCRLINPAKFEVGKISK